jgi:hypothetical protein
MLVVSQSLLFDRSQLHIYRFVIPDAFSLASPFLDHKNFTRTFTLLMIHTHIIIYRLIRSMLVVDEGHRLKNKNSSLITALQTLHVERKMLMTGTPIQNSMDELWTLLNFLKTGDIGTLEEFEEKFGVMNSAEKVAKLQEILRPIVLRRMKESVAKSIPPKDETIIDIELTTLQKKYYRAIYERNSTFLRGNQTGKKQVGSECFYDAISCRSLTHARKSHDQYATSHTTDSVGERGDGAAQGVQPSLAHQRLRRGDCAPGRKRGGVLPPNGGGEWQDGVARQAAAEVESGRPPCAHFLANEEGAGHRRGRFNHSRFCQSLLAFATKTLTLYASYFLSSQDYCKWKAYGYERLDGSVTGNMRIAAIDRFCRPDR